MANRRFYENPPIGEALCQFRFETGREWDIVIPGLLYQKIQSEFPERRQQKNLEVLFDRETSEVKQSSGDRIQFRRADGSALVQLGPDLLVVHILAPYSNWESFKAMILGALGRYYEVAEPAGIRSMALRYINRIRIPASSVQIEDYLLFSPSVPSALPQTFVGWGSTVNIPLDKTELLRITAGSGEENDSNTTIFLLDIEVVAVQIGGRDGVESRIDRAHEMIETAFEECITDKARMMFKEEVPHEHAQRA
jgi:uncharacterized protein (TIGR04255 family)